MLTSASVIIAGPHLCVHAHENDSRDGYNEVRQERHNERDAHVRIRRGQHGIERMANGIGEEQQHVNKKRGRSDQHML